MTAGRELVEQVLPSYRNYTGSLDPGASLPRRVRRAAKGVAQGVRRLGKRAMTYFSTEGKRVGSLRTVRTRPLLKEWLKTLGKANVKDSTLAFESDSGGKGNSTTFAKCSRYYAYAKCYAQVTFQRGVSPQFGQPE